MKKNSNDLKAGFGRTVINLEVGYLLAGFAARDHGSECIHDDLTVTVLALETDRTHCLIIALDLSGFDTEHMDTLVPLIESRFAIPFHRILVNCSHTHAGLAIFPRLYGPGLDDKNSLGMEEQHLKKMYEKILDAADNSVNSIKNARVSWKVREKNSTEK